MKAAPRSASVDAPDGRASATRRRALVYALVVSASVAAVLGYAGYVIWRTNAEVAAAQPIAGVSLQVLPTPGLVPAGAASPAAAAMARPYVLFRTTALGDHFGRVSLAYLDALAVLWAAKTEIDGLLLSGSLADSPN